MKYTILFAIKRFAMIAMLAGLLLPLASARAYEFDPSYIISNDDINDFQSMTLNDIQSFLSRADSFLANYVAEDFDGGSRFASEIIYNASQRHMINPKWILVTLQKEQSLVMSQSPSQEQLDWAMGYAVCDDCSKDDPGIQKFKGFAKQIDRAAARVRFYQENPEKFNFKAGLSTFVDDIFVTIKNVATAVLYNYTPHIHGNKNFWKIWTSWFAKHYPDGSLVQAEGDKTVWLIQNGRRRAFSSKAVLQSYFGNKKPLVVSPADLAQYELAPQYKYPNFSVVRNSTGDIYLLSNNERRKIPSQEAFRALGFHPDEVEDISDEDLLSYEEGREVGAQVKNALGRLLQDPKSGGVYYADDTFKYPIVSKEILKVNFSSLKVVKAKSAELDALITAQKVKFKDGTLVKSKSDPSVYVISNGARRHIANEKTFKQLGYNFKEVVTASEQALSLHPLGDAVDVTLNATVNVTSN